MSEKFKQIKFDEQARAELIEGVNIVAKAVASTLGPGGRDVIIDNDNDIPPTVTNDGVTVANAIKIKDAWKNLGAKIVRQAASKTNEDAGDGTSSSTILTSEIVNAGSKLVAAGLNAVNIKRGIKEAAEDIADQIKKSAIKIDASEENFADKIKNIANVSGQEEIIGDVLSEVFSRLGEDSIITIEDSNKAEVSYEIRDGIHLSSGWLSPFFCSDMRSLTVEMQNPAIIISANNITSEFDLVKVLEGLVQNGRKDVVVIAPEFSGLGLNFLAANHQAGNFKVVPVKAPYYGKKQKAFLEDIAFVTGATIIDANDGRPFQKADLSYVGTTEKVVVEKESTVFFKPKNQDNIPARIEDLKSLRDAEEQEYLQEEFKERIAALGVGVGIIKVGAYTEVDRNEIRYKVEDAINAVRSALEEGYLPGGGVGLYNAAKIIDKKKVDTSGYPEGYNIVLAASDKLIRTIAENLGLDGAEVLQNIKDGDIQYGFNAATLEYGDMVEMGIIDPAKVVRSAVLNAASAASTLLVANTAITTEKDEPKQ